MGNCVNTLQRSRREKTTICSSELSAMQPEKVRLLLLGIGESGKSTLMKQAKILYNGGYSYTELEAYRPIIYANSVQSLKTIIRAMSQMKIHFSDDTRARDARLFLLRANDEEFTHETAELMQRLWVDNGTRECFKRGRKYGLNDSAHYYLKALDRISHGGYEPTVEDVLRTRVVATGVDEIRFVYKGTRFRMYDVGGMRSDPEKVEFCFEHSTVVLFVASLSDHDLAKTGYEENDDDMLDVFSDCREYKTKNRLIDSLRLFDAICNSEKLAEKPIFLLLNKADLFKEKIRHTPISVCFPEYDGSNDYEESGKFIKQKFEALNRRGEAHGRVITYFTSAVDTKHIGKVFDEMTNTLESM